MLLTTIRNRFREYGNTPLKIEQLWLPRSVLRSVSLKYISIECVKIIAHGSWHLHSKRFLKWITIFHFLIFKKFVVNISLQIAIFFLKMYKYHPALMALGVGLPTHYKVKSICKYFQTYYITSIAHLWQPVSAYDCNIISVITCICLCVYLLLMFAFTYTVRPL